MTPSQDNKVNSVKVQMARYEAVPTSETYNRKGWIEYGANNLYPSYLIDLFDSAPVHGSLSTSIIEMISGKGLDGDQTLIDTLDLNSILSDTAFDLKLQGGYFWEIIWSMDRKTIVKIEPLEFENTRLAFVENEEGGMIITGVYYSRDWTNTRKKCNTPVFIPKLDGLTKETEGRQSFWHFGKTTKSRYYPKPDYDKSLTWIITEKQIGIFHMNNLLNGLMPQFMIHFNNGILEPEEARRIKMELERQMGAENAGGFMVTFNESGKESPKVDLFPISDADKQYQFLSEEATRKVMIGHRVTTPLLFGIRDGGGLGSNKDEMMIGLKIFNQQVIEPYQRDITDGLTKVFQVAGIDAQFTIVPNDSVLDAPATVAPVTQTIEEKKKPQLTKEVEQAWIEFLMDIGEVANPDWIEIDQYEVDYEEEDKIKIEMAVSTGSARPNSESAQDKRIDGILYITRYRYDGGIQPDTRPFCRKMLEASKLYRKEDIMGMGDKGVNPGWGPRGVDNYSIWMYKGGGNCHHVWKKVVYVSAKDLGIDVNSPKAKEIAVSKAADAGYKTRNTPKVAQRPIDMPYNGFLPPEN